MIPLFINRLFCMLGAKCVVLKCARKDTCLRANLPYNAEQYTFIVLQPSTCTYYILIKQQLPVRYNIRDSKGRFTKEPVVIIRHLRQALRLAIYLTCSYCANFQDNTVTCMATNSSCFVRRWITLYKLTEEFND